jgi:hypothetical protein
VIVGEILELGCGLVFEVNPSAAVTTTTLSSSPNPSTYGQAVAFTATVTSSIGSPPDGEIVSFMKGTTVLGTGQQHLADLDSIGRRCAP